MRVLVFGAAGFIGYPLSQALVRAGHTVYGQTRSPNSAKQLVANEINAIVAGPLDVASWESIIGTVDVVIEALGGQEKRTIAVELFSTITKLAQERRPAGSAKITYIWTAGTWFHGDDRKNIVSDTTPLNAPMSLLSWGPAIQESIISSSILNGIVIRPSMVYGRSGSIFGIMFKSAYEGKLTWPGKPGGRLAVIHQDDVADFYVRVAEQGAVAKGLVFDVSDTATVGVDDLLARLAETVGLNGYEYAEPTNPYEEAIASTSLVRPYLGRALLGWYPRKNDLVENIEAYYNAWKANNSLP
ncbi:NAD(P)-binding protein [Trametopsis cervina]|nr:NAD(P)-binding protein [Trametopsis cervina]